MAALNGSIPAQVLGVGAAEEKLNREAANAYGPTVWKHGRNRHIDVQRVEFRRSGPHADLQRNGARGSPHSMRRQDPTPLIIHYEPKRRLVRVENTARLDHQPKVVLSIEGYATGSGRGARLMRNNEPVNLEMLMLGQIRVLAGLSRKGNY